MNAVKRPGRGVKLTADERHAYHHARIAETKADAAPRPGEPRRNREYHKQAWWTLTGHLRNLHGIRRSFMGMSYADVEALHASFHQEQP